MVVKYGKLSPKLTINFEKKTMNKTLKIIPIINYEKSTELIALPIPKKTTKLSPFLFTKTLPRTYRNSLPIC